MATQNQYTSEPETPVSPLGVRSFRTIERLTKHLLAERCEGRSLHENYESADRRQMHAERCMEFWPLPTGKPQPPDSFVQFVGFVQYVGFVQDTPFDPFAASVDENFFVYSVFSVFFVP